MVVVVGGEPGGETGLSEEEEEEAEGGCGWGEGRVVRGERGMEVVRARWGEPGGVLVVGGAGTASRYPPFALVLATGLQEDTQLVSTSLVLVGKQSTRSHARHVRNRKSREAKGREEGRSLEERKRCEGADKSDSGSA